LASNNLIDSIIKANDEKQRSACGRIRRKKINKLRTKTLSFGLRYFLKTYLFWWVEPFETRDDIDSIHLIGSLISGRDGGIFSIINRTV
jgi:hypothetical protein